MKTNTNGNTLGPGVDFLSDGAYFIVSPSMHHSGEEYRWINAPGKTKIAALKRPWLKRIRSDKERKNNISKTIKNGTDTDKITEGTRNNTLTSLAGGMVRQGLSEEAIIAALTTDNKKRCDPPLEEGEVIQIIRSVLKYKNRHPVPDFQNPSLMLVQELLAEEFSNGANIAVTSNGSFWVYQNGVWTEKSDTAINHTILEFLKRRPSEAKRNLNSATDEIRRLLRTELISDADIFRLQSDPISVINCKNGELWFDDDGEIDFRPHSSKSYLIDQIPIDYDPGAECPLYDQAVLDIFSASGKRKSMTRNWNELVGYVVQPTRLIPLIVIMWGSGANGKTVLSQTLIRLVGIDRVMAARIEDLDKNRFLTGSLLGKLLYIDDDVRQGIRLPDGPLKKFSEQKVVTGDRKFKTPITFVNRSLPMLLCNNVPSLNDLSHGMMRRLMVIPFEKTFDPDQQDPRIFEKIWSTEMSGVLNRAVEGWQRLRQRGSFKWPTPVKAARDHWLVRANPLKAFIEECVIRDPESTSWLDDIYDAYTAWSSESGLTYALQKQSLKQKLEDL